MRGNRRIVIPEYLAGQISPHGFSFRLESFGYSFSVLALRLKIIIEEKELKANSIPATVLTGVNNDALGSMSESFSEKPKNPPKSMNAQVVVKRLMSDSLGEGVDPVETLKVFKQFMDTAHQPRKLDELELQIASNLLLFSTAVRNASVAESEYRRQTGLEDHEHVIA